LGSKTLEIHGFGQKPWRCTVFSFDVLDSKRVRKSLRNNLGCSIKSIRALQDKNIPNEYHAIFSNAHPLHAYYLDIIVKKETLNYKVSVISMPHGPHYTMV
jgi:hypothetical protein